ncbi:MAG TPA: hypothetical protein QF564_13435 [Pirellulaceae bacterium]|jgi:hypothetical protein|nr:hypothetical protein [Pirellulaceae bacterium]
MRHTLVAATLISVLFVNLANETRAAKAGFAERDITPDIGMEQPGGYRKGFHRSFHDACKVRAAVFDDGDNRVAILGLDALTVPRHLVLACRKEIEQKCGIPADSIMIAASHSHSSGPTGMVQLGEYDHASEFVQKLAYEQSSAADPVYLERLENAIVEAICEADQKRVELNVGFGSGIEDKVAFNRRFRMKNGFAHTHPGQGNPDIVGPAGPTDPEVGVVAAWDDEGQLVGCIVNFACHATVNPGGISANYIYYLERVVRGVMGEDVIVVFTAGASGDITQVDNLSPFTRPERKQWSRMVGGRVGAEAVKVMYMMETTKDFSVASRNKVLKIQRRLPRQDRVKAAYEMVKNSSPKADATELTFAKETVMLDAKIQKEPIADVEVQAVQVGPAVFVSNPAEYFCQYGLDIKKGSEFPLTFPVSLANGCVGYVPTEEALGPRGGGYETRLSSYSNLIPTAGTTIASEGIALTKQLKPSTILTRPPHPKFSGRGWQYGNLPPQVD